MSVAAIPQITEDLAVDMRLVRMPGRKDMALLVLGWTPPATGVPTVAVHPHDTPEASARRLRDLGPLLGDFLDSGEISGVTVVARTGGDEAVRAHLVGLEEQEDLASLLLPAVGEATVLLDGVTGDHVESLAGAASRVLLSSRQPELPGVDAPRLDAYGNGLVDAHLEQERARNEPVLDAEPWDDRDSTH